MTTGVSSGNFCARILRTCAFFLVMIFLAIAPDTGWAQTATIAPLPPAAQEALDKGIIAARVPDYPLAIRFFEDARKLAPAAPVVFMNLGIAESKMPGRELRAMTWFGAYLTAYPDAPNAAAVKEQIAVLEVKNLSNISRLIKAAQDAAILVTGDSKDLNLVYVAALWAKTGDVAAALKTAETIGDRRGQAQQHIAIVQAKAGDIAGAQKTAGLIQMPFYLIDAQLAIADTQIRANDMAAAQATLASALKTADLFKVPWHAYDKSSNQIKIAEVQTRAADSAGARKTLTAALNTARLIEKASLRPYFRIATAQVTAEDIAGAQKTTDLIPDGYEKSDAQQAIAKAQIATGDFPGAQKTLASAHKAIVPLPDESVRNARLSILARTQLEAGDIAGALRTAVLIQRIPDQSSARYNIAFAQIEAGDFAGAQKTADLIPEAQARRAIAQAQASAHAAPSAKPQRLASATPPPGSQPPAQPVATVSDWLGKLDDSSGHVDCALNTPPFLDLAGHLKSLPRSDTAYSTFQSLREAAEKIVIAQNVVHQMLKQQAGK